MRKSNKFLSSHGDSVGTYTPDVGERVLFDPTVGVASDVGKKVGAEGWIEGTEVGSRPRTLFHENNAPSS